MSEKNLLDIIYESGKVKSFFENLSNYIHELLKREFKDIDYLIDEGSEIISEYFNNISVKDYIRNLTTEIPQLVYLFKILKGTFDDKKDELDEILNFLYKYSDLFFNVSLELSINAKNHPIVIQIISDLLITFLAELEISLFFIKKMPRYIG